MESSGLDKASENVILTVRLIRSFEHRNIRNVVLRHVDLGQSVGQFNEFVKSVILKESGLPPPFKKFDFDSFKIEHQAYGAKTSDPVINREDDENLLLTNPDLKLADCGIKNETTLSFFKLQDYQQYKAHPTMHW